MKYLSSIHLGSSGGKAYAFRPWHYTMDMSSQICPVDALALCERTDAGNTNLPPPVHHILTQWPVKGWVRMKPQTGHDIVILCHGYHVAMNGSAAECLIIFYTIKSAVHTRHKFYALYKVVAS